MLQERMHNFTENTKVKQCEPTNSLNNKITPAKHLHVFGMGADAVYQLIGLDLTGADFVNGGEKWEFLFHALSLQHVVDLLSGDGTLQSSKILIRALLQLMFTCLQLLTVQHFLLKISNRLSSLDEGFTALTVTST